jgi:hypothetical protein
VPWAATLLGKLDLTGSHQKETSAKTKLPGVTSDGEKIVALLISGAIVFLGIHIVPMSPSLKHAIIGRIRESPYKLSFPFLSDVGLVLIIVGFGQFRGSHQDIQVWPPPV